MYIYGVTYLAHSMHLPCRPQVVDLSSELWAVDLKETATKAATIAVRNSVLKETNATWELVQHSVCLVNSKIYYTTHSAYLLG